MKLIILHTNDIHGRIENLTKLASIMAQVRHENPDSLIVYFDAGDSEDHSNELSSLTKGGVMHRLLSRMGCLVTTPGNAALPRYGPQVLAKQAAVSTYPHLMANLRMEDGSFVPGAQATTMVNAGSLHIGLIGVTAEMIFDKTSFYEDVFGLKLISPTPLIRDLAQQLRQQGADIILLLSHMGIDQDREFAQSLSSELDLIIGGHSHTLLPNGEWVDGVLIAQAGDYAQNLGRIDCEWLEDQLTITSASLIPIPEETASAPELQAELAIVQKECDQSLAEVIGTLATPFDYADDRPCQLGHLMAKVFRERYAADVGLCLAGACFDKGLPAGNIRRSDLWQASSSPGCGAVAEITGAQLEVIVQRGHDPERVAARPSPLRGKAIGYIHLDGAKWRDDRLWIANQPINGDQLYKVASGDWLLSSMGGYVEADWQISPTYPEPHIIIRELLEEYLQSNEIVTAAS